MHSVLSFHKLNTLVYPAHRSRNKNITSPAPKTLHLLLSSYFVLKSNHYSDF